MDRKESQWFPLYIQGTKISKEINFFGVMESSFPPPPTPQIICPKIVHCPLAKSIYRNIYVWVRVK
jgi:hypothetical protein